MPQLTQEEWLKRYTAHMKKRADLTDAQAEACANAERFEVLSADYDDDPEGAADEEISCWSD